MSLISQNKMAMRVVESEGGAQSLSIAQVKEVQGLVLDELAREVYERHNFSGVGTLLKRRAEKLGLNVEDC